MKQSRKSLGRLVILAALTFLATPAWAIYNNCTSTVLPMIKSLPAIRIPSNLPLGQPIPGTLVKISAPITCSNYTFSANSYWRLQTSGYVSTPYFGVYRLAGMPEGIGVQVKNSDGIVVNNYTTLAPAPNAGATVEFYFEFVKITNAPVKSSAWLQEYGYLTVNSQQYANGGNKPGSLISMNIAVEEPSIPTCNASTSSIQVKLPKVAISAFTGMGSTTGRTGFSLDLICEASAAPMITFSDNSQPANATSLISLAGGSAARGIAFQMLSDGVPVVLSPNGLVSSGGTVIRPAPASSAQTTQVPLAVEYVQTTTNIQAGMAQGVATFTLSYL